MLLIDFLFSSWHFLNGLYLCLGVLASTTLIQRKLKWRRVKNVSDLSHKHRHTWAKTHTGHQPSSSAHTVKACITAETTAPLHAECVCEWQQMPLWALSPGMWPLEWVMADLWPWAAMQISLYYDRVISHSHSHKTHTCWRTLLLFYTE